MTTTPDTWVPGDEPHPRKLADEVAQIKALAKLRAKEALDHPRHHKCDACRLRRRQQQSGTRDAA